MGLAQKFGQLLNPFPHALQLGLQLKDAADPFEVDPFFLTQSLDEPQSGDFPR